MRVIRTFREDAKPPLSQDAACPPLWMHSAHGHAA
jgi:hypothetical protein